MTTGGKENRDKTILVSLEETVFEACKNYAYRNDLSASGYVRSLIIKDLIDKGLLTEQEVVRLATGV